jgi:hypothetical protein
MRTRRPPFSPAALRVALMSNHLSAPHLSRTLLRERAGIPCSLDTRHFLPCPLCSITSALFCATALSQPFSHQSLAHSLPFNGGVPSIVTPCSPAANFRVHSSIFWLFLFKDFRTLPSSVSSKSLICRSSEKGRGIHLCFPFWNHAPDKDASPERASRPSALSFRRLPCTGNLSLFLTSLLLYFLTSRFRHRRWITDHGSRPVICHPSEAFPDKLSVAEGAGLRQDEVAPGAGSWLRTAVQDRMQNPMKNRAQESSCQAHPRATRRSRA